MDISECYAYIENKYAAADMSAVNNDFSVLLTLTGPRGGSIYLAYIGGVKNMKSGFVPGTDITLTMSPEVFDGIRNGQINPVMAFTTGQISATGNVMLAMSLYRAAGLG